MYINRLSTILVLMNVARWGHSYTIPPIQFELFDNKFILSLPNDPKIMWVTFHVNINKEFRFFEDGHLAGDVSMPRNQKWSYEFDFTLRDTDILYIWLAVEHDHLVFAYDKLFFSIEDFKNGKTNYTLTTTTENPVARSTESLEKSVIDFRLENKICHPSISVVPKTFSRAYCQGDIIFSDDFNTFNDKYWTSEIRLASTSNDMEFVLYNDTLGVEGGVLKIEASLNTMDLKKDSIDLGQRCTSVKIESECSLVPKGVLILPPIISGRLSTKNLFQFKYGRIEVRAKLPTGDWLFPLISLKPSMCEYGEHYKSGEMRIAYARGNYNLMWQNKNINGRRLFGGVIFNSDAEMRHQFMKDTTLPNVEHFGDEFHLYSLTWAPDYLSMAVDGNEYGRIKTNFKELVNEPIWNKGKHNAPLDQMFYITLGLAAGGNGDFPNTDDKPWSNSDPRGSIYFYRNRGVWFPTWFKPSLEVDFVRVYAI